MKWARALAALLVTAAFLPSASGRDKATGLFSNLSYSRAGGDMVGVEVFLIYAGSGYVALLQCGAGRVGVPALVPALVDYPSVSFVIPENSETLCPSGQFTGKLSPKGLSGGVVNKEWPKFLPRKQSHWQ